MRCLSFVFALATSLVGLGLHAQQLPPIRQLGKLERVSPDSVPLASVRTAVAMPGGRVMINDAIARRAIIFDSTLARATVVADTTSATANAYGTNFVMLMRFRGDSALLIAPSTLSMFVVAPNGSIARTMAVPRPSDAFLLSDAWIKPGIDAHGRLIYLGAAGVLPGMFTIAAGAQLYEQGRPNALTAATEQMLRPTDSAVVVRADLDTRVLDTVAWVRIPKFRRQLKADADGRVAAVETTPDALPVLDLATVLRDGTLAVVRGTDFHIDWIDASAHTTPSPKIPFDWKKVDDARKHQLIDSTVQKWEAQYDQMLGPRTGGVRPGRGGIPLAPQVVVAATPADLPDYAPPFSEHAVDSDSDDNVWIQTTTIVDGRPVYDVVNRRGELMDRVQVPAFRTIAGFGPGLVYLAVQVADRRVHLERVRIH